MDKVARKLVTRPSVLVCHEKHGNRYFAIPDDEALKRAALKILGDRVKDGYWYGVIGEAPRALKSVADLGGLPDHLWSAHNDAVKTYKRELDAFERRRDLLDEIAKSLAEKDGVLAWRVLRERSEHEYERVSLEVVEAVPS